MVSTRLLTVLICLLGCCISQTIIKQSTLDDPLVVLELNLNETSDDCLKQMQGILRPLLLTPGQVNDLSSMIVKSGKGINQLGLYEGCNEENNLRFAIAVVRSKETNLGVLTLGLCVPKQCDSNSLTIISN